MGGPEGLNTHAQSEQPQPLKRCSTIHTSLRRMASLAQLAVWRGYGLAKVGVALVFSSATATTKDAFALREIPHRAPLFERASKLDSIH
jgi:hypothetical protein